ncbi:alpha/beta fold hydrolase [Paenibacillus montanisoli]|uniref:Alpha/beta hydrolase n=1 Tax=Paenibacillus montanisoli TaxID=2081970 RepID=A0A328U598_9BACL|nr:alpha/beta fold hydrolase [Paenibacillus montanisoli]RAP77987.1 alpha/beta hydrolase [Paenibacillus montanisoli]
MKAADRGFTSGWANSGGVRVHFYDSGDRARRELKPLLICPGLSETAEEYADLLEFLLPRRCIVLSFRGRGRSDTPASGYDLDEHVADIAAVVRETGLRKLHLFGHSRGASYALGYARLHASSILSLLVSDYPAEHRQMPEGWAASYYNDYLIPHNRTGNIRLEAVQGIQQESKPILLDGQLPMPALVLRGKLDSSLLSDSDLERYRAMFPSLSLAEFYRSGHDLMGTERPGCFLAIHDFLNLQSYLSY